MNIWHESLIASRNTLQEMVENQNFNPLLRAYAMVSLWNTNRMIDVENVRHMISEKFQQHRK